MIPSRLVDLSGIEVLRADLDETLPSGRWLPDLSDGKVSSTSARRPSTSEGRRFELDAQNTTQAFSEAVVAWSAPPNTGILPNGVGRYFGMSPQKTFSPDASPIAEA